LLDIAFFYLKTCYILFYKFLVFLLIGNKIYVYIKVEALLVF